MSEKIEEVKAEEPRGEESQRSVDFKLREGREVEYRKEPGKMVNSHGKYWAFVPKAMGVQLLHMHDSGWKRYAEMGLLTFIDEHPGYERVEVLTAMDIQIGDAFIWATGELFFVDEGFLAHAKKVGLCYGYLDGLKDALGSVLRPYPKEQK